MNQTSHAVIVFVCILALAQWASAAELADVDVAVRLWAAPIGSGPNSGPFAPAAELTGVGNERGRGEADLRLRHRGLTTELSARTIAKDQGHLDSEGVVNELYYEDEVLGQHLTVGKKVVPWDVGFGFRPLDVVQQEDRRALHPFALEGIPLLGWEWFGESSALAITYANPIRLQAAGPRSDASLASRYYYRLDTIDLYAIARYSERTRLQAGVAASAVLGEALEVHGSFRYQRRNERLVDSLAGSAGVLLVDSNPVEVSVSKDAVAALAGFTITPGGGVSVLGEAWYDPSASTSEEWHSYRATARKQKALLNDPNVPSAAVLGNLAWGMGMFDRPNLLRENVLLRVSWKWERFEPAADVVFTPADGGYAATAVAGYEGEGLRFDGGVRYLGGRTGSAYRLFPQSTTFYAAMQVFF